ncbi:MAG: LysR family transcriptional regulator [Alphaproteobacteria bacterium]|nr:LysR family transcriptional regulator [Alphaproteobacteria bacterium]
MNVTSLETFLAVVKTGSLIAASKQLNVTQSTVTARLHTLEDEMGQQLLLRQKTGASLTASGLKFQRYAEVMVELWRQARQETSLPDSMTAIGNIGCHVDLWPHLGHQVFTRIFNRHQDIALTAWPSTQMDIDRWMASGVIDVAIGYQPSTATGQTTLPIGDDQLVLVADRPDRPLRHDPGYVYVDGGEAFARGHTAAYTDAGIARVSFGSSVWARQHLLDHGGSAYLPLRLITEDVAKGRLFLLDGAPQFSRPIVAVLNSSTTQNWPWLHDALEQVKTSLT